MTKEEYNTNRPKIQCPNCGKLITNACFRRHYDACINPDSKLNSSSKNVYTLDHEDLLCKFCSKEFTSKNALVQHEIRCRNNPQRKDFNNLSNYISAERKGRTKEELQEIQKQVDTMLKKYVNGYVHPNKGKHVIFNYIYEEHNQKELSKWFSYISTVKINIPKYSVYKSKTENYIAVKITKDIEYCTKKDYLFEHQLIISTYMGNINIDEFTVHHIDKNRENNSISNLIAFKTNNDHKRFHNSKFAYLLYDEIEHPFTCEIRKIV